MPKPKDEIIADIDDHIHRTGGAYAAWQVGIAKDSHNTLFASHSSIEKDDGWMYREAFTPSCARAVVEHFRVLGAITGGDAPAEDGRLVYVYKKVAELHAA